MSKMEVRGQSSFVFISTVLSISLLVILFRPSFASHFGGGAVMWRAADPSSGSDTIEISHRFTERDTCSLGSLAKVGGTGLVCRTGCSGSITDAMSFYCYDNIRGVHGTGGRSYTYNPYVSSLEASFADGNWLSTLVIGSSSNWELRIKYRYIIRSGKMNSSPVTAMAEVVGVQYGCSYLIKIPVADYDGDDVRCRWASRDSGECSGVCQSFPGAYLDERTCELEYNSVGQNTGYYVVAIQIEDFASSTDTVPLSSIPLQFLVNVINDSSCGEEPWISNATLPDGAVKVITYHNQFNYEITAQASYNSSITAILATITPFGIQLQKSNLTRGDDNQWSVRISWTPSEYHNGSHMLCYYAMDSNWLTSAQSCVELFVQEDVDECSLVIDNCTQICIDTLLSYKCACVYGYTLQSDGRTCVEDVDVDECALLQDDCTQICINTIGSYECGCREGYKLHGDGRACVGTLLQFEISPLHVKENNGYILVYLLALGEITKGFTIDVLYQDYSAELGIDYQPVDYVAHFTANTIKSSPIKINIIDDNGWEESETFTISFTIPDGVDALKGEPEEAIITILDNDEIVVHFPTDQVNIEPGISLHALHLVTKQSILTPYNLTLSCIVTDGISDEWNNCNAGIEHNVTFLKHATTSSEAIVYIPPVKCLTCVIWPPKLRGVKLGFPTIIHLHVPIYGPTFINFDHQHYYGKEGESVVIGLHASQPILRKFRVAVSVLKFNGTDTHSRAEALSGADYELPSNVSGGSVRFDPSLGLNSTYLELFLNDDGVIESTEYFVLTITIDNYLQSLRILPGPHDETIVAIEDNNSLLLSFQYARYIVNEYDQRLTVRLEVLQVDSVYRRYYVSAMHSIQITVTIRTREDSAKNGTEFIEKTERVRFFPGDQYSTEMNISILDDHVAEPKEMFYLHFEIPKGLEPKIKLLNNQVPVVIEDDERVEVWFDQNSFVMTEGAGVMLMVQLTMNGISSLPISVTVKPSDGTATEFLDYFADGVENVAIFEPYATVSNVAIIHIINDNIPEETEFFYLTLEIHNDTNKDLNIVTPNATTSVTVMDDDWNGTTVSVDFELTVLSGREGTLLNVTVVRKGRLSAILGVPVTAHSITAVPSADYSLLTTFIIFSSLGSMEEKQYVMVKLQRDSNREEPELFLLYLHPPPGVQSTKQQAIIRILP